MSDPTIGTQQMMLGTLRWRAGSEGLPDEIDAEIREGQLWFPPPIEHGPRLWLDLCGSETLPVAGHLGVRVPGYDAYDLLIAQHPSGTSVRVYWKLNYVRVARELINYASRLLDYSIDDYNAMPLVDARLNALGLAGVEATEG